jgi:alpha-beta hydrolase superfamily lysophospholipase
MRRVSRRQLDTVLRLTGGGRVPIDRPRIAALGLPDEIVVAALDRVRAIDRWPLAWSWAGQRLLGESRDFVRAGRGREAARARAHAALAFHVGTWLTLDDPKTLRTLRAASASLFRQALPATMPAVQALDIPWRARLLPAYLAAPVAPVAPLAVLLNGSSTSKEETIGWAGAFLAAGIAVLALDWPGTGEAMLSTGVAADCDDMVDGIVAAIETHPLGAQIDARRLALVGFSLGAVPAVRTAALDHRVRATVAVTPPYDPTSWLPAANGLLLAHLASGFGGYQALYDLAPAFSLVPYASRLVSPLLALGAGRDLLVPPNEALRLCAAAGDRGALLWYPDAGHGLYAELADWTALVAAWLRDALVDGVATSPSTWVDRLAP